MKKFIPVICFSVLVSFNAHSQALTKAVNDAFIITRMVERFHVEPRLLNDSLSADFYHQLLIALDPEKIYFTKEDIDKFQPFKLQLDDEIAQKKSNFIQLLNSIYSKRIDETDSLISTICKTPFNFNLAESYSKAEDTSYASNKEALKTKLYKKLKLEVLDYIVDDADSINLLSSSAQKKYVDSVEVIARKKLQSYYKRFIEKTTHNQGIEKFIGENYCSSLAVCYDPHTEYFPPVIKENFESELGEHGYKFGFSTSLDDDGNIIVNSLKPGSPAYKSGLLNTGDKIKSIQWEGQEEIDVSDSDPEELNELLSSNNHDKMTMKVKKLDGTIREVSMKKEKSEDDDDNDNKVRSFLLKGKKTIGYILLPAFYTDWDNSDNNVNGCANDVAKEIVKLEKENIQGLILDLRYNGGGSVEEAVDLSGLFIDAGPVEMFKGRDAKIYTLKDVNRGTIYNGPLALLINGYTASASEMVAGTLQDYNRALIVGTPSYGKATAQVVLPLDTTVSLDKPERAVDASAYLKITMNKLYRINGSSAQKFGVKPDIILPDPSEMRLTREAQQTTALNVASVDANKYYKANAALPIASLQELAAKDISSDNYFTKIDTLISAIKTLKERKEVSLKLSDALNEHKNETSSFSFERKTSIHRFSIDNNQFEKQRMNSDEELKDINEKLKEYFVSDPYIEITYDLVSSMSN